MKPKFHHHSCPVCGHRVTWWRLYVASWIWAHWHCSSCRTLLAFDFRFRCMVAILALLWTGFIFFVVHPRAFYWTLVVFLLGSTLILQLDHISVAKSPTEAKEEHDLPEVTKET